MGRILQLVLLVSGAFLVLFNLFTVNYKDPWNASSQVSWIGVAAGLCAILIVLLNRLSLSVENRIQEARKKQDGAMAKDAQNRIQNESRSEDAV